MQERLNNVNFWMYRQLAFIHFSIIIIMQVSMVKPYQINSMKPKAFLQPNHPHHSAAQNQLYKIVLHTRHKLIGTIDSLIHHKTKQL